MGEDSMGLYILGISLASTFSYLLVDRSYNKEKEEVTGDIVVREITSFTNLVLPKERSKRRRLQSAIER